MSAPVIVSAQSTDVNAQIQNILSQIKALQDQLMTLRASVASSTGSDNHDKPDFSMNGASTIPRVRFGEGHGAGDMNRMKGAVCAEFSRTLARGSHGDDVAKLQEVLRDHGMIASSSITGTFGPRTEDALKKFQERFGIASSSTGAAGPATRGFLQKRCVQAMHHDMGGDTSNGTTTRPDRDMGMTQRDDGTGHKPPRACFSGADGTGAPIPCPPDERRTHDCIQRPACLDATPRCMIAEPAGGWCPATSTDSGGRH